VTEAQVMRLDHLMDDQSPTQLKLLAAKTLQSNEEAIRKAFRSNNVKTHFKGAELELLEGINPFMLLPRTDQLMLQNASNYFKYEEPVYAAPISAKPQPVKVSAREKK
jgi:hypothetical protein